MNLFQVILTDPLLNLLIFFYKILFENFGLAIIALTLFLKTILFPLSLPSLKMLKKQNELAEEIAEIKSVYGKDKTLFAKKQMELYQKHGINPASGCLPQILQFAVLIALYNVFLAFLNYLKTDITQINPLLYFDFLKFEAGAKINTAFLYLDLAKPDPYYIMPVLAGIAQFLMSKFMTPPKPVSKLEGQVVAKTSGESDDMMYNMQKQMLYMGPIMTVIIGINFPSGLVFYWFLQTVFQVIPQWILNKRK